MIVYILGRGFSGSTILDIALTQSDGVEGMGELLSGLKKTKPCACGRKVGNCEKWENLYSGQTSVSKSKKEYLKNESSVFNFFKYFFSSKKKFNEISKKYLSINSEILNVRAGVGCPNILVDSSKEVTRGLILARGIQDVVLIHLIRDPYEVLSSHMKCVEKGRGIKFLRKRRKNLKFRKLYFLIVAFSWLIGNIFCELSKFYTNKNILRVRYEDICKNSDRELSKLESKLNVDLMKSKKYLEGEFPAKNKHQVGGNSIKMKKNLYFDNKLYKKKDNHLTKLESFLAIIITGPLRKIYGY